jgi:hypothetical protein
MAPLVVEPRGILLSKYKAGSSKVLVVTTYDKIGGATAKSFGPRSQRLHARRHAPGLQIKKRKVHRKQPFAPAVLYSLDLSCWGHYEKKQYTVGSRSLRDHTFQRLIKFSILVRKGVCRELICEFESPHCWLLLLLCRLMGRLPIGCMGPHNDSCECLHVCFPQ